MTKLSVFTAADRTQFLDDCYTSLRYQSIEEWEWVVLLNRGAGPWQPRAIDPRVRIYRGAPSIRCVGAAKAEAVANTSGSILVELDSDDVLLPDCLERVEGAFLQHPESSLVYSDWTHVSSTLGPSDLKFDPGAGWKHYWRTFFGQRYLCWQAMTATPHNVGYIWYAPNHVRAFSRWAYETAGGYDRHIALLDDQDLMVRLFPLGTFTQIPECLYMQRFHNLNLQSIENSAIQVKTVSYYKRHISNLATAWSERLGLRILLGKQTTPSRSAMEWRATGSPRSAQPNSVGFVQLDISSAVSLTEDLLQTCWDALAHGGIVALRQYTGRPIATTIDVAPNFQLGYIQERPPSFNGRKSLLAVLVANKGGARQGGRI
ncbi:glycosyltransferase family 2 protein [Naasia sp. SYSU D00948]|uniref:glycosyltransferase family 2 protein n=1 Tax=Naasia sp. SYSU D00948 TaxID=2817379 RepID=UPI001B30D117|nr:glycosyltransferase family 2 protein [Naasia sp. SYSU D00948]